MTSSSPSQATAIHAKRISLSSFPAPNPALLLEKSKAGIRQSTPDSEALASSDEEQDHHTSNLAPIPSQQVPRVGRRASWLNEVQQISQRKSSVSSNGPFPASSPHLMTPPAETSSWTSSGNSLTRPPSNNASFPWGNTIWNNDAQKGPPTRLAEVLPSPTGNTLLPSSMHKPDDSLLPAIGRHDSCGEGAIPFAIPLHPTPKTYRSQSYSVGQLDPETTQPAARAGHLLYAGRTRAGSGYSGLQHRPSRPSMLGDFSHDHSGLEQLREVDDDEEEEEGSAGSDQSAALANSQARTIEQLAMENAMLRQAAIATHMRIPSNSQLTYGLGRSSAASDHFGMQSLQQQMSESVLDDADETPAAYGDQGNQAFSFGAIGRRSSEYDANGAQYAVAGTPENRMIENTKKGHWQSSLGFGGLEEVSQSRRHSFAEVPVRQHGNAGAPSQNSLLGVSRALSGMGDNGLHSQSENTAYFSTPNAATRNTELQRSSNHSMHQNYVLGQPSNRAPAYGLSQHYGQILHLVTFKAARAEFYYVQEGTGLHVKAGDLVIVEADRGTDLGTVTHENVDWNQAKELKDKYVEEHYKWLMMFSRNNQSGPNGGAVNPMALPARGPGSTVGGMHPQSHGSPETASGDIKPKMIKRLAQAHDIQTLREKEANEAKAKRMCQQKVVEHHLNMEILDAEFQMDWKKLTFYYFADSYINFNSLVTDLFKIYKTRIWMSAINPASFLTPAAGLQLPSGIGPGALAVDRDHFSANRSKDNRNYNSADPNHGFDALWNARQEGSANAYAQFYQSPGLQDLYSASTGRSAMTAHATDLAFTSQIYGPLGGQQRSQLASDRPNGVSNGTYLNRMDNWGAAFHGLSLGS